MTHQAHAGAGLNKIWLIVRHPLQVIYIALGLYGYYILGTEFDFEQVVIAQSPALSIRTVICRPQQLER